MRISHDKMPQEGWKYYESRTNITLVAGNWDGLVSHLKNHRKNNGLEEGEVEKDIEEQICKTHPELVIS